MFQFPGFPSLESDTRLATSGFPHSEIVGWSRLHTADRRFSQCTTSFFGTGRPGIPRVPCLVFTWFDGEAELVKRAARVSRRRDASLSVLLTRSHLTRYSLVKLLYAANAAPEVWLTNSLLLWGCSPGGQPAPRCCPSADGTCSRDKNSPVYRAAILLTPSLPF
jgi:hypothetical protein